MPNHQVHLTKQTQGEDNREAPTPSAPLRFAAPALPGHGPVSAPAVAACRRGDDIIATTNGNLLFISVHHAGVVLT
jgi:hypothetical protein